jgi:PAS domain S-box-containing protein
MPGKKDNNKEIQELKQRISLLETENKHLRNELHLTVEEKETAKKDYFDIISNMEEKVEQRTRETKELQKISEAKGKELQFILDISPAMIFYKDTQQRYIRVNQAFAKTLGIPIKKIIGKTFSELFPDTSDQFLEEDLEVMKTGKPMLNIDSRVKTRKGWRDILVNKIPYKDIDGNIIGIIGFALDITDLKHAEKEKKDLEKRLTQMEKMDAIGRLAGGVAHDLNNVLSAVVSYPDLLLMKMSKDSPFRRSIITMQKAGQKAAAIVEDLLILARRGVPTTEVISLNDIIDNYFNSPEFETLKMYNPQVEIKTDLEPDLLNIKGSPRHLTKTIMNLVSNAAEAVPGKGTVTLTTCNRYLEKPQRSYDLSIPIGEYVVLSAADTGEGIHSEDLKRIFDPFYTKKVMGRRGTGLGMAVVWGTVKYHNGNIEVNSIEGEGTTFELYFPVTREPLTKVKTFVPVKQYVGHNERILVVDDIQDQLEIITTLLTSLNYSVKTAGSGEEAVEYLKTHTVDLVLLDMIMDPGMDGLDTYKKIIELHPGQKALITSGYSETERIKEALRLGAGQYIKKPYSLEKIGFAVRAELDKR